MTPVIGILIEGKTKQTSVLQTDTSSPENVNPHGRERKRERNYAQEHRCSLSVNHQRSQVGAGFLSAGERQGHTLDGSHGVSGRPDVDGFRL